MGKWNIIFVCAFVIHSSLAAQAWKFSEPVLLPVASDTTCEESLPLFDPFRQRLFFVRSHHPQNIGGQDIWMALKHGDQWNAAQRLASNLNTPWNEAVTGITEKGVFMLQSVFLSGNSVNRLLFAANHQDGFSAPGRIKLPEISARGRFFGYAVPQNQEVVMVSMENRESLGQDDLYVIVKDEAGRWQKPVNLGHTVNSKGYDFAPFLLPDLKTLFYSSNGRSDSENADIYVTKRMGNWQEWTEPERLDDICSSGFDAYFSFDTASGTAYFCSNRERQSADIFTAILLDSLIKKPETTQTESVQSRNKEIVYDDLPDFLLDADASAELGTARIYFETNQYQLNSYMKELIGMLSDKIRKYEDLKVEIKGFADDLGSESFNLQLSAKRAESVKKHLVSMGIAEDRFQLLPMGESSSKPNPTELERQQSRRVDITLR